MRSTQTARSVAAALSARARGVDAVKPLQIHILRSGYAIGQKHLRTVGALEAELIRLHTKEARVLPAKDVSYRKVAAALRVLQRRGVLIGFIGNVRSES